MTPRRFPPPWSVEDIDAAFVVKDSAGRKLAYVYFEDEQGRRAAAKQPTGWKRVVQRGFCGDRITDAIDLAPSRPTSANRINSPTSRGSET
jgi:hypothetical protein